MVLYGQEQLLVHFICNKNSQQGVIYEEEVWRYREQKQGECGTTLLIKDAVMTKPLHQRCALLWMSSHHARVCVQLCWCRCWVEDAKKPCASLLKTPKKKRPRTSPAHQMTLFRPWHTLLGHLFDLFDLLGASDDDSCRRARG